MQMSSGSVRIWLRRAVRARRDMCHVGRRLTPAAVDNGYDCSDYEAIDPKFGDMETNQRLIDEVRQLSSDLALLC